MPTLYDNFERVRQYIDQQTGGSIDLSSYVTKDELSAQSYLTSIPSEYITQAELSANSYLTQHQDLSGYVSKSELSAQSYATTSDLNAYLPLEGGTISGRLVSDYYTTVNASGGIDSYSSVLTGGDNRNSVTMFATRRLCGDTSYAAAFFTNSDGRSKFTHKTKTSEYSISGADDAFMCFNAYGFKIAYSGEQGVAASTEYEILHEGNIGNLGYITEHQSLNAYVLAPTVVTDPTEPYRPYSTGLAANNQYHHFYPVIYSYANSVTLNGNAWAAIGTVRNYVNGRIEEIEASYITSSDVSAMGYITMDDVSACGYITSIPNTYASYTGVYSYLEDIGISNGGSQGFTYIEAPELHDAELNGNILINGISTDQLPTYAAISAMGYATTTDLNNHLPYLGTLQEHYTNSEHFLPKTNNTYYLGNSNFRWQLTYTYNIFTNTAYLNDTSYSSSIVPKETNTYTLGDSSYIYNSAYVNSVRFMLNNYMHRLYCNGQYTLSCQINGVLRYSFMAGAIKPERSDVTIGTSSSPWPATYTSNLYADNAYISNYYNLIWTGTSAEYAALDNYTTYQIYLIQEA